MKNKGWIEARLKELEFVEWDRYYPLGEWIAIYGWIDRKKDSYKDFVLVLMDHSEKEVKEFHTSSANYSEKIDSILFGSNENSEHNECRRVEDKFKIENMIELQQTL